MSKLWLYFSRKSPSGLPNSLVSFYKIATKLYASSPCHGKIVYVCMHNKIQYEMQIEHSLVD
jgi:hypothetical protein